MATAFFCIHGKLDRFCERKVSAGRYGTFIVFWKNAAARAVKDAQMRIAEEIARQPADGKRFKFPILVLFAFAARRQFCGLLSANTRMTEMNECENSG